MTVSQLIKKISVIIFLLLIISPSFSGAQVYIPEKDRSKTPAPEVATPEQEAPKDGVLAEDEFLDEEEVVTAADPIEPWNRAMFTFNDRLYFWGLKPAAKGYNHVVPEGVRVSVNNFFKNITMPIRFVNSLLQLKLKDAGNELLRFGINSTVGVAGLFDLASTGYGIKQKDEDLGQTLGVYGIGNGFYIVWPFLGPSTMRDSVGYAGDSFLNPINYLKFEESIAVHSYDRINYTSLHLGEYEDLKQASLDPYLSIRDAYIQNRNFKIRK